MIAICQRTGRIICIHKYKCRRPEFPQDCTIINYGALILTSGLLETHVHLNEAGRISPKGVFTGIQADAAGGITTVLDTALNSTPERGQSS